MDEWKSRAKKKLTGKKSEERSWERKKTREGESQKEEDSGARKGKKVAKHFVFPMFCGSGWSKSRLAKAADAEPADQMRD